MSGYIISTLDGTKSMIEPIVFVGGPSVDDQAAEIKSKLVSASRISMLPATLFPVRTNNFSNFSKDFFLPTTLNHAINTQNTFKKVIAVIGAIFLDLLTLPIRLITSAPRALSNALYQNPFKAFLIEKNADKVLIDAEAVNVQFKHNTENFIKTVNYIQIPG